MSYQDALRRVIDDVIAPNAAATDRTGEFPRANLDALAGAGILGLCSSTDVGGGGLGLRAAADVVTAIGRACASTAMIVTMHYAATAAIEALGPEDVRRAIAAGEHLSTLAFSETGSRSQFWAPVSTATETPEGIRLDASKSWVTSAGDADSYVWSSRPVAVDGLMTLWLVPSDAPGCASRAASTGSACAATDRSRWSRRVSSFRRRRGSAATVPGSTSRSPTCSRGS